jgi:threonine/homoserine/homoserine lactone efflux protein
MSLESMITLAVAMFILAASPGPGIFAATAQALSGGFRSSLDVIAGIVSGVLSVVMVFYCLGAARMRRLFSSPRSLRNLNRGAGVTVAARS